MSNQRVAVLSVHTSPMDQPGSGDSGGMNVYIRAVAERLVEHDVEVDLFTRCRGADGPEILEIGPGVRLLTLKAGPCAPVPKSDLPRFLPEFLGGVLRRAKDDGRGYDILHSHYWLSGWVGNSAKDILGIPLVASFHTLGKVKNYSLARGEAPEPRHVSTGEERVIAGADRILAPTPAEAAQLVGLYRADPEHIRIVPPGVDHAIFFPRERSAARDRLHLSGLRLALFVGRLQAHKGPDVAVRTLAEAVARDPELTQDLVLAIVGGPSGTGQGAELARLMELAAALGVSERVMLFPPLPQARLADVYAAADVVLVPSRSESFGLVALEAQACGTPVVAAAVGRPAVRRGRRTDRVPGGGARPGRPRRADAPDPPGPGARRPSRGRSGAGGAPLHVGRHGERARRHLPRADGGPEMIKGERVTLRPVEERDYPLIHAWQNDPEVWWLMDYEAPFSLADIAASEKRATEEGFPFIIEAEGDRSAASGSTTSAAGTASARSTSSSATGRRGGRAWGPMRSTPCSRTRSRGSTSIRSSCGRWPRTNARSARTRTPGSGRRRGSPSARGRTAGGSIAS